ncbi:hypothetical protein OIDMADRAFT_133798 [Oidiodendron maius Zn]|uniref:Cytochrome P450 monooxygenase n=1 Tax=Oidiodendron maius (strain Zn) TaxID=913774 RepID=A0A0C3GHI7_OIDMZ|nr:hypothetical protein OIDMADRAFT_133798 [Oidiodendron maius Zn]
MLISIVVYNIYFHPLAKFPGPKLYAISQIPWAIKTITGRFEDDLRSLHARYGDVVRFAPDELSFITPAAWKDIYGHGNTKFFVKAHEAPPGTVSNILRANDADHARFRKLMSHAFSDRALREQYSLIAGHVDRLISKLNDKVSGNEENADNVVDIVSWYNFTTFDLIGDLAFGESFDCLKNSSLHTWVALIFRSIRANSLALVAKRFNPLGKLLLFFRSEDAIHKWKDHMRMTREKVGRRLKKQTDRPDFMTYILRHNDERGMSLPEIESNASFLIMAGSETTATALSGVTYLLLRNPEHLTALVHEIRSRFPLDEAMDISALADCKYLNACLQESLRMYPPVPIGLRRLVVAENAMVAGYHIPKGTVVSLHSLAAYRSPSNFANPNQFLPGRWIDGVESSERDKNESLSTAFRGIIEPFSVGPRNCLGKNLAWVEMRLILARVLRSFDLELVDNGWNPDEQKIYTLWEKPRLNVKLKMCQE